MVVLRGKQQRRKAVSLVLHRRNSTQKRQQTKQEERDSQRGSPKKLVFIESFKHNLVSKKTGKNRGQKQGLIVILANLLMIKQNKTHQKSGMHNLFGFSDKATQKNGVALLSW